MYLYVHVLNLCLIDLTQCIPLLRNILGTLSTIHNFIRISLKKYAVFKKLQKESNNLSNKTIVIE